MSGIHWTKKQYREFLEKQNAKKNKDRNRNSRKTSNLEPNPRHEPMAKRKVCQINAPVHIHIHSVRKRLADIDGISGKAAIDGLVEGGILPDDNPKYVKKVSFSQEKDKDERTIITIQEV